MQSRMPSSQSTAPQWQFALAPSATPGCAPLSPLSRSAPSDPELQAVEAVGSVAAPDLPDRFAARRIVHGVVSPDIFAAHTPSCAAFRTGGQSPLAPCGPILCIGAQAGTARDRTTAGVTPGRRLALREDTRCRFLK
jgi:hypothetical protein